VAHSVVRPGVNTGPFCKSAEAFGENIDIPFRPYATDLPSVRIINNGGSPTNLIDSIQLWVNPTGIDGSGVPTGASGTSTALGSLDKGGWWALRGATTFSGEEDELYIGTTAGDVKDWEQIERQVERRGFGSEYAVSRGSHPDPAGRQHHTRAYPLRAPARV